jgi:hypothetical protein
MIPLVDMIKPNKRLDVTKNYTYLDSGESDSSDTSQR